MYSLRLATCAAALGLCLAVPAQADVDSDTKLLADSLFSESTLDATFEVLQPVLAGSIDSQLRAGGLNVSDPDAYTRIFIEEFRTKYADIMREDIRPVLSQMYTPEELADIAAFIQTPSGQKFFATQGDLSRAGAQLGQSAGGRAGVEAIDRIIARLDEAGITFTDAAGNAVDTSTALRGQ